MQPEQNIPHTCRLYVSLQGPLEVWRRTADETWERVLKEEWGKGKPARSVFKRLLAQPGRRLSRGRLQEDLWPDIDVERADKYLYNAISLIHRIVGKDLVKTWEAAYELAGQSLIWVDIDACEQGLKVVENQGCQSMQAQPLLEQILTYLERGELLEGESGIWCYSLRMKAENMLRQCRLWLAEAYEAQGKIWQAGEQYRIVSTSIPPDEDALQEWMGMLHRQGKAQEALKCYQDVKRFAEEQGCMLSSRIEQWVASLDKWSSQVPLNSPLVQGVSPLTQGIIVPKQDWSTSVDQLRRKFLQDAQGMLFPLFFGIKSRSALDLDEIISHGSNIIRACWHLMKGKEIKRAEELLNAYIPTLLHLTFQTSPYQQAIAQVAAQACMIRAIIAKHHLNPIAREMYCHEAIQCSRLSGDKALHAGALMYLGYTYTFCSPLCPKKAIETFLEALRVLGNADNLVKSDICIGLADAYALVNDELQAKHAIHMAQDCFPSHPEQNASFFYADCGLDTLYQWEAKMYLDLAQHDQRQDYYKSAWNVLEQSTKIHAISERCTIETVIYQTTAALGLHDLDAYASYLTEGASTALHIGSPRRYQEALALYHQAPHIWKQEPRIQNIATFFQEAI